MTAAADPRITVVRVWRGRTTRTRADEYAEYSMEAGIRPLMQTAIAVDSLRRDDGDETEFMVISYWESIEAMSRFAGNDPKQIHHLDRDAEFLIDLPEDVHVYEIHASHWNRTAN